ncbi:MAG: LPXTG cell wall anchor domain-containing protein [Acutalibacteraceae bacterium]
MPQAGADDTTSNTPQTGDESSLALLLTMLLASAAGFGVMGLRRREEK